MLTKVTAYSQWSNVEPLVLHVINRSEEIDWFEVRNFDGLGAVAAEVNTTKLGSIDGESFVGSSVGKRNIVATIGLDPDWNEWTMSKLRRILDKYFTPKQEIRLVFETMEFSPVEIFGYIESNEPNMFSKDPEHIISIICPDLYFKSVDPVIINGTTDMDPVEIDYEGNVETGMVVTVDGATPSPEFVNIQVNDPLENSIRVPSPLAATHFYKMSSIPGDKYVRRINSSGTVLDNFLNSVILIDSNDRDKRWPVIGPGTENFEVATPSGAYNWELSYYNMFASL